MGSCVCNCRINSAGRKKEEGCKRVREREGRAKY